MPSVSFRLQPPKSVKRPNGGLFFHTVFEFDTTTGSSNFETHRKTLRVAIINCVSGTQILPWLKPPAQLSKPMPNFQEK